MFLSSSSWSLNSSGEGSSISVAQGSTLRVSSVGTWKLSASGSGELLRSCSVTAQGGEPSGAGGNSKAKAARLEGSRVACAEELKSFSALVRRVAR